MPNNEISKEKKTFLILHGGSSKGAMTEEQIAEFDGENWKKAYFYEDLFQEFRQAGFEVIYPHFSDSLQAEYLVWEKELQEILKNYQNCQNTKLTVIAHSLGGAFAAKFFTQNPEFLLEKMYLIAPAIITNNGFELTTDNLQILSTLGPKTEIWHSTDDKNVPATQSLRYHHFTQTNLVKKFSSRSHFTDLKMREIVA